MARDSQRRVFAARSASCGPRSDDLSCRHTRRESAETRGASRSHVDEVCAEALAAAAGAGTSALDDELTPVAVDRGNSASTGARARPRPTTRAAASRTHECGNASTSLAAATALWVATRTFARGRQPRSNSTSSPSPSPIASTRDGDDVAGAEDADDSDDDDIASIRSGMITSSFSASARE